MKKKKSVMITMGSDSDLPVMNEAGKALSEFGIDFEVRILSAHRTPKEMMGFAEKARADGFQVIIAGAGGAAHLPGMIAAVTELPVIGVPVAVGPLEGQDALLSIVQMPKGVPVACVAIGLAWNAGILAAQILGVKDSAILDRVKAYKEGLRKFVLKKKIKSSKN